MQGIELKNGENDIFIPYHAINRLTIEPNTEWQEIQVPWYRKILSTPAGWVKTGKWDLVIETIGQHCGRIIFETHEAALKKLEEFKAVDLLYWKGENKCKWQF